MPVCGINNLDFSSRTIHLNFTLISLDSPGVKRFLKVLNAVQDGFSES